jgi:hypothetical protein
MTVKSAHIYQTEQEYMAKVLATVPPEQLQ